MVQLLSDTFQTLPLVILDDAASSGGAGDTASSAVPVADMLQGLRLKARNLALSELVLHWSLTDASAPDPTMESSGARKRLRDALIPAAIPASEPMTPAAPWADLLAQISGPEVPCVGLQQRSEELPAAVKKFLSNDRDRKSLSVKEQPCRDSERSCAPEVEHILMTLPSVHLQLLHLLGKDQGQILQQAAGVDPAVARSGLLSTDALDHALANAKDRELHIPGSQRYLLRAYAALAIVKQTALLLVYYGVRCAHLHLRHHLDPLPGLAVTCKASAEALAAAYQDVETGRLQDHPNQEAVRRTLATVSALHPPAAVKRAAEAAIKAADCVLATYDHVAVRDFPLSSFHCLIECISSPFNGKGVAATAAIASAPCPRHVLLDVQVTLEEPQGQQEQPNAGSEDSIHRVIMPRDVGEDVSKDAPSWCLVVNSSPDSLVRSRRQLHNMLMQLERAGAAVIDRHMSCADLALSGPAGSLPSILRERVGAQLALLGMAYSKCILCFEGSKVFEPAILACIDEVAVLGKRCGVGLSILITASPEETEIAISTAVRTAGKGSSTTTGVAVPEIPSPHAAFLESFPSLNPFTAAKLAALPCSLQKLLCRTPEEQEHLSQLLPEVPQRIIKLFFKQAASGVPVLQGIAAAAHPHAQVHSAQVPNTPEAHQAREAFEESSHMRPSSAQSSGSARMLNVPETAGGNATFLGPSGSVLYFDGSEGVPAAQDEVAYAGSHGGGWDQYLDTGDESGHHQQQQPQQHKGWDFQAQDSNRQEALAWQATERSYAENDYRQLQSAAEPVARQQYQQPSAYMPHTGRGNAYQGPLYSQPYSQPYSTPPYGAIRGMGPNRMHAHSGPYAQRVPPTHEMPVLQESSHVYQEGSAYSDRLGQKQQQLGAPLRRQTYSGFGQNHDNDVQLVRSATPAQPYMDAPCPFGEPMLQARQPLHQTTPHDYPLRAIHNTAGQYMQSNQPLPDAHQYINREGMDEFGVSFDVDEPLALDDDAFDSDAAVGPYQPDQEDLFSTIEDDSPQRPERQFKKPKFLGYESGKGYSKQAKLVWRPCGGRR
ncbi:g8399 [Coccomyxa elongata]